MGDKQMPKDVGDWVEYSEQEYQRGHEEGYRKALHDMGQILEATVESLRRVSSNPQATKMSAEAKTEGRTIKVRSTTLEDGTVRWEVDKATAEAEEGYDPSQITPQDVENLRAAGYDMRKYDLEPMGDEETERLEREIERLAKVVEQVPSSAKLDWLIKYLDLGRLRDAMREYESDG